jgi:hypothetical protein
MSRFSRFLRLAASDRWLVLEALVWLGLARAAVLTLPFRWVAAALGQRRAATEDDSEAAPSPQLRRVAWALRRVSRYTPWRSNCLAQALAGHCMLRRRRLASILYFGVAKDAQGELEAHAWLRSGGMTLTGDIELERYAVVAAFTDSR